LLPPDVRRLKCTKFNFDSGSVQDPAGGAYSAPPNLLAVFKGAILLREAGKGREGEGRKGGEGRRDRER